MPAIMDLAKYAIPLASGTAVGGGVTWLVVKTAVGAWIRRYEDLAREVRILRDEKIADIHRRLEKVETFEAACPADRLGEKLDNALGWMKKIDGKLDLYSAETAKQGERIAAQMNWMQNLDRSHREHTGDRSIHEVHRG